MENYSELLSDNRWKSYRLKINKLNKWTCRECDNQSYVDQNLSGEVFGYRLFKQTLHGFSEDMMIRTTLKIEFQHDTERLISYITSYDPLSEHDLLGSTVYFTSLMDPTIQAIRKESEWKYVRELHVHHPYYQETKLPWEYPETVLQSLCWKCHMNLHTEMKIEWMDALGRFKGELSPCPRCAGAGTIPEYDHVQNGICFKCHGACYLELIKHNS